MKVWVPRAGRIDFDQRSSTGGEVARFFKQQLLSSINTAKYTSGLGRWPGVGT